MELGVQYATAAVSVGDRGAADHMQAFWFVPSAQVWRTDYERSGKDLTDVVLNVNSEDPRVQVSESVKVQDQRSSSNSNT